MLEEAAVVRGKGTECVEERVWDSVKRSICMIDTRWVFYERVSSIPQADAFHPACVYMFPSQMTSHAFSGRIDIIAAKRPDNLAQ